MIDLRVVGNCLEADSIGGSERDELQSFLDCFHLILAQNFTNKALQL